MYYLLLLYICICVYCVYIVYVCFSAVLYKLPTLKSSSSGDDNEHTFSCFAKDFSPKPYKIKWLKNDVEITDKYIYGSKTPIEARDIGNGTLYSAAIFLTVKNGELSDDPTFTCKFDGKNENGEDSSLNSTVNYKTEGPSPCPSE